MEGRELDGPADVYGCVPKVFVISDSVGDTAAEVVLAACAQFESGVINIQRLPKASTIGQIRSFLDQNASLACAGSTAVFYTIANRELSRQCQEELDRRHIMSLDVLGPAVDTISRLTGILPTGKAGVIRRTDERYFRRIEAMEFFVNHDDGRNTQDLTKADIVLIGVSRTSKTPVSMYLSFHGYRVANIPLAPGMTPPAELFDVEPFRLFGLLSVPGVLSEIRTERLGSTQAQAVAGSYADPLCIAQELEEARALMRRLGCIVVATNGRAVEETAQIILSYFQPAETAWRKRQEDAAAAAAAAGAPSAAAAETPATGTAAAAQRSLQDSPQDIGGAQFQNTL